jgi:serine/threonine protein kinase
MEEEEEDDGFCPAEVLGDLAGFVVSSADFEIHRRIGHGAHGEVFLAAHRATGKKVAVKRFLLKALHSTMLVYFCREVKILADCANFFLLPFLGFSVSAPYVIVTEFIARGSLYDALAGRARLSADQRLVIALGIARGMAALHDMSVIHRDLKSLNILLDDEYLPRICDFGIARFLSDADATLTQRIGTPHWMAPEMFQEAHYTLKADVYSFAIILWELLTGTVPFKGRDALRVAIAVSQHGERPPLPPGVAQPLAALIAACWDALPENRPTFAQIVRKLSQKRVCFPGGSADALDAFLARFPFSRAEAARMAAPDGAWSAALEAAIPDAPGFSVEAHAVPPGQRSPVERETVPLAPPSDDAAPAPFATPPSDDPDGRRPEAQGAAQPPAPRPHARTPDVAGRASTNFEQFLMGRLAETTERNAAEFFAELAQGTVAALRGNVFAVLSVFLYRNPGIVPSFLGSGLLQAIPWDDDGLFEGNLRLLTACLVCDVTCVTVPLADRVSEFAPNPDHARRLLKFWALFLTKCDQHPEAAQVLRVFVSTANCYLFSVECISMLYSVYGLFPDLRAAVLPTFQCALASPVPEVATACYRAFAQIDLAPADVPLAAILAGIADGTRASEGLEILARLTLIPPSSRVVAAVLAVAQASPLAIVVLCRLGMSPMGAEALAQNTAWLAPGLFPAADAVLLLLVVGQHSPLRAALMAAPWFAPFLAWLALEAPPTNLIAVVSLLRRMPIGAPLIAELDLAQFFQVFFPRTLESQDLFVIDSAIMLIVRVARVAWADVYVEFIRYLPMMLTLPQLQTKALVAALVIVPHPAGRQWLLAVGLGTVLAGLALDRAFEPYRQSLLAGLSVQIDM